MAREILLRDMDKCISCQVCVTACGNRHGQARMTMLGDIFGHYQLPAVCLHCENPVCVTVCPYNVMQTENGKVFVAPDCRGCRQCLTACPHAAIVMKQVGSEQSFFETVLRRFVQLPYVAPPVQITTDSTRCIQCGVCSNNCPVGIDVRSYAWQGLTLIDERCVQCGLCVDVCPRRTLTFDKEPGRKTEANKCDLCRDYGQSACVSECPTGAMIRLDASDAIKLAPELDKKLKKEGQGQKMTPYNAPPIRK